MVSIEWDILLLQMLTFLIALPMIWSWLLKPLVNKLKERENFIKESVEKVENERKEIERLKQEHEKGMKEIEQRSKEALAAAIAEGEKVRQKMIEDAKEEGSKMIQQAKKEIEMEKEKAIVEVRDKIVDMSFLIVEKIIKNKVNKKAQMGIVNKYIKDIEKRVN